MEVVAKPAHHGLFEDLSDPTVLLTRVVDGLVSLVPGADGAVVELLDGDNCLYYAAAGGRLAGSIGTRVAPSQSLSGLALQSRAVLRCDDTDLDSRVDRDTCRHLGIGSMICAPLVRPGGAFGVVKLAAASPYAFSDADARLCEAITSTLAVLIAAQADLAASTAHWSTTGNICDSPKGGEVEALTTFVRELIRPGTRDSEDARRRIEDVLANNRFTMVCQPIVDLHQATMVGVESLARFTGPPDRSPDRWFAEAHHVGLGDELELAAVTSALALFEQLPRDMFLALNLSPSTISNPKLSALLLAHDPQRTVVELTEHVKVDNYCTLRDTLVALHRQGVSLSIDDTGAGFASLSHIVKLAPRYIKLDRELVCGIDVDPVRRALGHALVVFAHATGASVIAEGIETADELAAVTDLGFDYGQGFHLGRPMALPEVLETLLARR